MGDSRLFHSTSIHFPCLPRKKYDGISSLGMVSGPKTDSSDPNYVLHWQRIRVESCLPVPPALESWTQLVWEDSNITHLINGKTCVHHGALLSEKLKDTISRYLKCMINIDQYTAVYYIYVYIMYTKSLETFVVAPCTLSAAVSLRLSRHHAYRSGVWGDQASDHCHFRATNPHPKTEGLQNNQNRCKFYLHH